MDKDTDTILKDEDLVTCFTDIESANDKTKDAMKEASVGYTTTETGCLFPCKENHHRDFFSHMVFFSHLPIIIPCIIWIFGKNSGPYWSHVADKLIACIITMTLMLSMMYHYYYECVLCIFEERANIVGIILLNVYLYYRGVPIKYILIGFLFLLALQGSLMACRLHNDRAIFEKYHPYCHYVAGAYVFYCVYHIQQSFK